MKVICVALVDVETWLVGYSGTLAAYTYRGGSETSLSPIALMAVTLNL